MRRQWAWLTVSLLLSAGLDHQARAAGKKSDDDLLQNMGDAGKTAPSAYDTVHKKSQEHDKDPEDPAANPPSDDAAGNANSAPAPSGPAAAPVVARIVTPKVVDRVKAVPRKELFKRNRLEISPYTGVSLNDAFYEHLTIGGALVYYPHDVFGIGLGAEYFYVHPGTNAQREVRDIYTSVPAVFDLPQLFAHLDFYWVPLYGKVSLFDKFILTLDAYTSVGFGIETAFASTSHFAAHFGIGKHIAINQWAAVKLDLRDHIYVDEAVVGGIARSTVQNYVMLSLGFSIFVPPTVEYTFQ